jgi:hypothetical protein
MIHAAQNTVEGSCLRGEKPIVRMHYWYSETSSALKQLNNEHDDGNHEQKMDQTAAKVADKAQKPEHD